MMNWVISWLIIILPCVLGCWFVIGLWRYGLLGRICLAALFMCGAVEAHSIFYPKKDLKEQYARALG